MSCQGEATHLGRLGNCYATCSTTTAARAFHEALDRAQHQLEDTPENYAALDTAALALCGLTLTDGHVQITQAIATFHAARAITADAGIVHQVLQLFDALTAADPTDVLHDVRRAAARTR